MDDFKSNYEKAGILMQSALNKYKKGDVEGGNRDREEANRLYDSAEKNLSLEQDNILYGESLNFGKIYNVFESNSKKWFKHDGYKIRKVVKLIKENKVLKTEFDIYKNFLYAKPSVDTYMYINESLSVMPTLSKAEIVENNKKLINLIRELNGEENVDLSNDMKELYESIEYLMINKTTLRNINESLKAKNIINDYMEKNCCKTEFTGNIDEIYEKDGNDIYEKYNNELNDSEKDFLSKLTSIQCKEEYFNVAKLNTLKNLNEQVRICQDEDKVKLKAIINNVNNREYDDNKFIIDTSEFREINNTILQESENVPSTEKINSLIVELSNIYNGVNVKGNEKYLKGEITYFSPDSINDSLMFEDIKRLSGKYPSEEVSYLVNKNMENGKYDRS